MQNYDPLQAASSSSKADNEPRMDPTVPRPRPPPPKYPPPAYVANSGDSVKENGLPATASSSSMIPTAAPSTGSAVGTGSLRERAPQKRPPPPKGPPPPKRSITYDNGEETSEKDSLLNNKSD